MYEYDYINFGCLFQSELIKYFAFRRVLFAVVLGISFMSCSNEWSLLVITRVNLQSL